MFLLSNYDLIIIYSLQISVCHVHYAFYKYINRISIHLYFNKYLFIYILLSYIPTSYSL